MATPFNLAAELTFNVNQSSLNNALRQVGATLKNGPINTTINFNAGSIANVSNAVNGINQTINKVNQSTKQANTTLSQFGDTLVNRFRTFTQFTVASRIINTITQSFVAGVTSALKFQDQLVKLSQITNSSLAGVRGIGEEVTKLATKFGVSSDELLGVSDTLAQAGLSANETKTAIEGLAKASLAPSFKDLNQATEGLIATFGQFGKSAKDTEAILGGINAVSKQFAVESDDIIKAIQRAGGAFAAAGGSLEELEGLFTAVRQTTRESAESIATGIRTITGRLQRLENSEALKKLGIDLRDTEGNFVGVFKAVERLNAGLANVSTQSATFSGIIEDLGGLRQLSRIIPLIQQIDVARRARDTALGGSNSLNRDAELRQQSLLTQIQKLREEFLKLFNEIGQSRGFQQFISLTIELTKQLVNLTRVLSPLIPILGVLGIAKGIAGGVRALGASPTLAAITQFPGFASGFKQPITPKGFPAPLVGGAAATALSVGRRVRGVGFPLGALIGGSLLGDAITPEFNSALERNVINNEDARSGIATRAGIGAAIPGAITGGIIGGQIGSLIAPGVGTAIGATIGALALGIQQFSQASKEADDRIRAIVTDNATSKFAESIKLLSENMLTAVKAIEDANTFIANIKRIAPTDAQARAEFFESRRSDIGQADVIIRKRAEDLVKGFTFSQPLSTRPFQRVPNRIEEAKLDASRETLLAESSEIIAFRVLALGETFAQANKRVTDILKNTANLKSIEDFAKKVENITKALDSDFDFFSVALGEATKDLQEFGKSSIVAETSVFGNQIGLLLPPRLFPGIKSNNTDALRRDIPNVERFLGNTPEIKDIFNQLSTNALATQIARNELPRLLNNIRLAGIPVENVPGKIQEDLTKQFLAGKPPGTVLTSGEKDVINIVRRQLSIDFDKLGEKLEQPFQFAEEIVGNLGNSLEKLRDISDQVQTRLSFFSENLGKVAERSIQTQDFRDAANVGRLNIKRIAGTLNGVQLTREDLLEPIIARQRNFGIENVTPEKLGDAILELTKQLDSARRTIGGIEDVKRIVILEQNLQGANLALKELADTSKRTSAIQERLGNLQAKAAFFKDIGNTLSTGAFSDKLVLTRTIRDTLLSASSKRFDFLSNERRGGVIQILEKLGNRQILGQPANKLVEQLKEDFFRRQGFDRDTAKVLSGALDDEGLKLQRELIDVERLSIDANMQLARVFQSVNDTIEQKLISSLDKLITSNSLIALQVQFRQEQAKLDTVKGEANQLIKIKDDVLNFGNKINQVNPNIEVKDAAGFPTREFGIGVNRLLFESKDINNLKEQLKSSRIFGSNLSTNDPALGLDKLGLNGRVLQNLFGPVQNEFFKGSSLGTLSNSGITKLLGALFGEKRLEAEDLKRFGLSNITQQTIAQLNERKGGKLTLSPEERFKIILNTLDLNTPSGIKLKEQLGNLGPGGLVNSSSGELAFFDINAPGFGLNSTGSVLGGILTKFQEELGDELLSSSKKFKNSGELLGAFIQATNGLSNDKLSGLTESIKVFTAIPDNLQSKIIALDGQINKLNGELDKLTANIEGLKKLIQAEPLPQQPVLPRLPIAQASGGRIPGIGNKDNVPAMLTPGEFVVRAPVAKKMMPFLEMINRNGLQFFQDGGKVKGFGNRPNQDIFAEAFFDQSGVVSPLAVKGLSRQDIYNKLSELGIRKGADSKKLLRKYTEQDIDDIVDGFFGKRKDIDGTIMPFDTNMFLLSGITDKTADELMNIFGDRKGVAERFTENNQAVLRANRINVGREPEGGFAPRLIPDPNKRENTPDLRKSAKEINAALGLDTVDAAEGIRNSPDEIKRLAELRKIPDKQFRFRDLPDPLSVLSDDVRKRGFFKGLASRKNPDEEMTVQEFLDIPFSKEAIDKFLDIKGGLKNNIFNLPPEKMLELANRLDLASASDKEIKSKLSLFLSMVQEISTVDKQRAEGLMNAFISRPVGDLVKDSILNQLVIEGNNIRKARIDQQNNNFANQLGVDAKGRAHAEAMNKFRRLGLAPDLEIGPKPGFQPIEGRAEVGIRGRFADGAGFVNINQAKNQAKQQLVNNPTVVTEEQKKEINEKFLLKQIEQAGVRWFNGRTQRDFDFFNKHRALVEKHFPGIAQELNDVRNNQFLPVERINPVVEESPLERIKNNIKNKIGKGLKKVERAIVQPGVINRKELKFIDNKQDIVPFAGGVDSKGIPKDMTTAKVFQLLSQGVDAKTIAQEAKRIRDARLKIQSGQIPANSANLIDFGQGFPNLPKEPLKIPKNADEARALKAAEAEENFLRGVNIQAAKEKNAIFENAKNAQKEEQDRRLREKQLIGGVKDVAKELIPLGAAALEIFSGNLAGGARIIAEEVNNLSKPQDNQAVLNLPKEDRKKTIEELREKAARDAEAIRSKTGSNDIKNLPDNFRNIGRRNDPFAPEVSRRSPVDISRGEIRRFEEENRNAQRGLTNKKSFADKLEIFNMRGFANGGFVTANNGLSANGIGRDTVPAMLSPGEYVINKESAQKIGLNNLNQLNNRAKFADGGQVGQISEINSEAVAQLSRALLTFMTSSERLSQAMEAFPKQINLQATHTVNVQFNGTEVFRDISDSIAELAVTKAREQINIMLDSKFPDIGKVEV